MKITVKIKTSGIDGLEKVLNKIKEIEKVNPHMSVDIEVDCRKKKLFTLRNFNRPYIFT